MITESRIMLLRIAGFNIKLIFEPTDMVIFENRLMRDIEKHVYSPYGVTSFSLKPDYTIIIKYDKRIFLHKSKKITAQAPLFKETSRSVLETNYYVSFDQFNYVLMFVLNRLLMKNDGFLLHCAAISTKKGAIIFVGNENAGKSTVRALLGDKFNPISDDALIIKYERGKYSAYQHCLIERNPVTGKSDKKYTIYRIFLLQKSDSCQSIIIKDKMQIVPLLLKNTSLYKFKEHVEYPHYENITMINFLRFIDTFSFYRLLFSRDAEELQSLMRVQ